MSRWARARDPTGPARNASSRAPAAWAETSSSRRGTPRALEHPEERQHAERDGDVGDVERRPPRELDPVRHRAVAGAVEEVAGGAAEEEPRRQPEQPTTGLPGEVGHQQGERQAGED